jgi:formylglycine-generating enzyme required for sulfatase activity
MECVSWHRAREFCKRLTEAEGEAGRLPKGYVYRLPTEAEWEYACRAGTDGPYNVAGDYATLAGVKKFAWLSICHGWTSNTGEVGRKRLPNAWGLYDMHGNVYEWCLDWYGPYAKETVSDPTGPTKGTEKVVRGGCFVLPRDPKDSHLDRIVHPFLRSASRYSVPPGVRYYGIVGFRVVLAPAVHVGESAGGRE